MTDTSDWARGSSGTIRKVNPFANCVGRSLSDLGTTRMTGPAGPDGLQVHQAVGSIQSSGRLKRRFQKIVLLSKPHVSTVTNVAIALGGLVCFGWQRSIRQLRESDFVLPLQRLDDLANFWVWVPRSHGGSHSTKPPASLEEKWLPRQHDSLPSQCRCLLGPEPETPKKGEPWQPTPPKSSDTKCFPSMLVYNRLVTQGELFCVRDCDICLSSPRKIFVGETGTLSRFESI
mmetsp:Transcript_10173/g.23245  ORF Transcript_10173/g.23245 Transcript_10173/m.23245 type:complete len:231 (+) Transcript_10173:831-1523(+)